MKRLLYYLGGVLGFFLVIALIGGILIVRSSSARQAFQSLGLLQPLADQINRWQRSYVDAGQDACLSQLAAMNVEFRAPKALRGPKSCGVEAAVHLSRVGAARLDHAPALSCSMALALAHLEADVIQPLAQQHFASAVTRIQHFGTYNCRQVRGDSLGLYSQHAFANALDLSGFVLQDGRKISVLYDWPAAEPGSTAQGESRAKGAFLHDLAEQACDRVSVVLGPNANAAHRDHLHVDQGLLQSCR